jgi:hypothetical protein
MVGNEERMNVAHNLPRTALAPKGKASDAPLRVIQHGLLPLSLVLWGVGISRTNVSHLGSYGLPAALPLVFYAGIALLLVSAGIEFGRTQLSELRLALHSVALTVMIYATAPLVYKDGRYSWLYKMIGVVQYVNAHGSVNRSIDIYQSWPGFFALASWFDKVAGVASPLDYAKWAQPVVELAAIPLLYSIYRSLSLPPWSRWLAIMLYSAGNWIGQDYFSPQAEATLLSLGIMAIATHWIFAIQPKGRQKQESVDVASRSNPGTSGTSAKARRRESVQHLALIVVLFAILIVTHQLSPYIIALQLFILVIIWLPQARLLAVISGVVVVGVALVYLIPNLGYLKENGGLTLSISQFLSNAKTPNVAYMATPPMSHRIIGDSAGLLSGGIWLLAIAGSWRQRKRARMVIALLAMTFTPIAILLVQSYGNEGILRIYLFSLPWAAALGSVALMPLRLHSSAWFRSLRAIVPLAVTLALFFPAFFGDDAAYVMPADEVETITNFLQTAEPGPIFAAIDNWPSADTSNYNDFLLGSIFDSDRFIHLMQEPTGVGPYLARTLWYNFKKQLGYIIVAPSMLAYNSDFGVTSPKNFALLESALSHSPYWRIVLSHDGTVIYQLTPAVRQISPGPATYVDVSIP